MRERPETERGSEERGLSIVHSFHGCITLVNFTSSGLKNNK